MQIGLLTALEIGDKNDWLENAGLEISDLLNVSFFVEKLNKIVTDSRRCPINC